MTDEFMVYDVEVEVVRKATVQVVVAVPKDIGQPGLNDTILATAKAKIAKENIQFTEGIGGHTFKARRWETAGDGTGVIRVPADGDFLPTDPDMERDER